MGGRIKDGREGGREGRRRNEGREEERKKECRKKGEMEGERKEVGRDNRLVEIKEERMDRWMDGW